MPVSPLQAAKRAFVSILLSLAGVYELILDITRDSEDAAIKKAFRKVSVKAHPDKGGDTADFQRLTAARDTWLQAAGRAQGASGTQGRSQERDTSQHDSQEAGSKGKGKGQTAGSKGKGTGKGQRKGKAKVPGKKSAAPGI